MGKGGGDSCERSMILDAPTGVRPVMVDESRRHPGSAVIPESDAPFAAWCEETDVDILLQGLKNAHSYPERVVIQARLRQINSGESDPLELEYHPQVIDGELERELEAHPYQLRALFLEDSLFKDQLLYAYQVRGTRKVKRSYFQYKLDYTDTELEALVAASIPESLTTSTHRRARFEKALTGCLGRPIHAGGDLDDQARIVHLKRHAKRAYSQLSQEQQAAVIAWMGEHQPGTRQERTRAAAVEQLAPAMIADVRKADEETVIRALLSEGAQVTDNEMLMPQAGSGEDDEYDGYELEPGKRFTAKFEDGAVIHYVPHFSVGTKEVTRHQHHTVIEPMGRDEIEQEKAKIVEEFDKHVLSVSDLLIAEKRYTADDTSEFKDHGIASVFMESHPKVSKHPKIWLAARRAASQEEGILLGEGKKWEHTMHYRMATPEELEAFSADAQVQAAAYKEKKTPKYFTRTEDGHYMYHRAYKKREQTLEELDAFEQKDPIHLTWDAAQPYSEETASGHHKKMQAALAVKLNKMGASKHLKERLGNQENLARGEITHKPIKALERVPHSAPYSERGVLKVENMGPEIALKKLTEIGLVKQMVAEVPYAAIYRGGHRRGRITPVHDQYASGYSHLDLPKDYLVRHSLTGAGSGPAAIERLEQIVASGGLKSIAERRRMGIQVSSMSPEGDIGSGIDTGVSASVSNGGGWGTITFAMRPEVLERRDIWFANQDYGGDSDRFEQYDGYAKSIGQGRMHWPPSPKARQKHFEHGLQGSNEAYFKHEVSFDEIDTLYVEGNSGTFKKVEAKVEAWKKDGTIPKHVRVIQNGKEKIADRAKLLNARYRKARGVSDQEQDA